MFLLDKGKEVLAFLEHHGHQAYLVGGCVRDYLLQREIQDIDICTSALPEQVMALFEHSIPTGLKHGTVTVLWGDRALPFEITTFRTDGLYLHHRKPASVSFVTSLKKDIERRDLTINALAMDKEGQIYDFFNGRKAIEEKEIKTVGNPMDRFTEDALRMLRAIRFRSQLGFMIDLEVMQAIQIMKHKLNHISMERITSEFEKIMASPYPEKGICSLMESSIIATISPFDLLKVGFYRSRKFHIRALTYVERWAFLLFLQQEEEEGNVTEFIRALTLRNSFVKEVKELYNLLCKHQNILEVNQFSKRDLFTLGVKQAHSVLRVNHVKKYTTESNVQDLMNNTMERSLIDLSIKVESAYDSLILKKPQELGVSGKELIVFFNKKPGPWIEECLQVLIEAVLLGTVDNRKEALLLYIEKQLQMESE